MPGMGQPQLVCLTTLKVNINFYLFVHSLSLRAQFSPLFPSQTPRLFSTRAHSYLGLSEGELSSATAALGGSWSLSSLLKLRMQRLFLLFPGITITWD